MVLELHPPPDNKAQVIRKSPDERTVESTVKNQPWEQITFIVLKQDEDNWFEISGSLQPSDGLSARYCQNGKEHVSNRAPKSLDEGVSLLLSYLRGDGRWQTLIGWN